MICSDERQIREEIFEMVKRLFLLRKSKEKVMQNIVKDS